MNRIERVIVYNQNYFNYFCTYVTYAVHQHKSSFRLLCFFIIYSLCLLMSWLMLFWLNIAQRQVELIIRIRTAHAINPQKKGQSFH